MTPSDAIPRSKGRHLFGLDPVGYDVARPEYPDRVFELLVERCGLQAGPRVIEIGAGTGLATLRLVEYGARSVLALEPDAALASFLQQKVLKAQLPVEVEVSPFEETQLGDDLFDLAVAATSFHWVEQAAGLTKVARVLRPGGFWAMFWNLFGDPAREDAFHEASKELLMPLQPSPSGQPDDIPFALDFERRETDLSRWGRFVDTYHEIVRWTLAIDAKATRALYATYSSINQLGQSKRREILDEIFRIANEEFDGRVERNMVTAIYTARRPDAS